MNQLPFDSRYRPDAPERALLARVSTGDRRAMDQLYIRYFARLALFFQNMTLRTDVVEELINKTMLEVWKGESIRADSSVLLAILRLAYTRLHKYFAQVRSDEPHSQRELHNLEDSKSKPAKATLSEFQVFLSKFSVEERAVVCLVYANGCSRRETADVMEVACDRIDVLLRAVRTSATQYWNAIDAKAHGID